MSKVVKLNNLDPIIERYLSSVDKSSIKKTLAFEYFNNLTLSLIVYERMRNDMQFGSHEEILGQIRSTRKCPWNYKKYILITFKVVGFDWVLLK